MPEKSHENAIGKRTLDASKYPFYNGFMTMYFGNGSGNPLADRRYDMALQLAEWGDYSAAADLLRQGLEMAPQWPPFHFHLGDTCRQIGRDGEAREAFLSYLALDPEDKMGAAIKLALLGATAMPESMPAAYVQSLFNQYAPKFEKCLVENLEYRTPELIFEEVTKRNSGRFENILDLGCGTGLAAQLFAERSGRMTGIDLAPAMIDAARAKNIYHALHVGDIDDYLAEHEENFDLVLCADVLVYIGTLESTFRNVVSRMAANGLFAFSVQSLEDGDWILGEDHRYAHSARYIDACAQESGMKILSSTQCVLRQDNGKPVHGAVYICAHA